MIEFRCRAPPKFYRRRRRRKKPAPGAITVRLVSATAGGVAGSVAVVRIWPAPTRWQGYLAMRGRRIIQRGGPPLNARGWI
jgi:hypothetical protein